MTFCVGIRVESGLIALADTQIVRGSERSSKAKLSVHDYLGRSVLIMTSGLRSVRDKAVIYFEESWSEEDEPSRRLHQLASCFGRALRRVRREDGDALASANLSFNSHAIIGGRLADDPSPVLFYVYPEGNWIEAGPDAPYFMIGRTTYGRPILDRLLDFSSSLERALALAYLAFDATRTSVTDVDFPVDVALQSRESDRLLRRRFTEPKMEPVGAWWQGRLSEALEDFPMDWAKNLLNDSVKAP
ncbi:MAG: proteasome-type protease [Myxococcales bacterium]|nr:proteasome-type protease [Myxococcales bacterium]